VRETLTPGVDNNTEDSPSLSLFPYFILYEESSLFRLLSFSLSLSVGYYIGTRNLMYTETLVRFYTFTILQAQSKNSEGGNF